MDDDAKWSRYAAIGGFWFVVLAVAGAFAPGSPPAPSDSIATLSKFFADHTGAIEATQLLTGLGAIGLAWWFGSLWRMMMNAEGGRPRLAIVAAVGFVIAAIFALASGAVMSAVAIRRGDVTGLEGFFYTLSFVLIAASGFGGVILTSAVSALAYRTKMLPPWIMYLGWLAGLGFLVSTLGSVTDSSGVALFGFGGFLLFCVWILAISVTMWRGAAPAATASTVTTPPAA